MYASTLLPHWYRGANRFETIRPYALYGSRRAANEPIPATMATMKSARTPYLSHDFAGDQLNLILCFLPRLPLIHETMS